MKTDSELKSELEAAKVILQLNVSAFLKRIKESAEKWKKELSNGN